MSKIALTELKFLHAGRVSPDPQWGMASHYHENNHELIIILTGRMRVDLGGEVIQAKRGDLLFYPAGIVHEERSDPVSPVESIYFGCTFAGLDLPSRQQDTDGKVRTMAQWLAVERLLPSADSAHVQQSLASLMIAECLRLASSDSGLVRRIRNIMLSRMTEALDLDGLAKVACMSRFHFLRVYKSLTGRTPIEDLRMIRLERARDLLLTTDTPIKNIPAKVGLANQHLMTRLFRCHFGTTPGAYRK